MENSLQKVERNKKRVLNKIYINFFDEKESSGEKSLS